MNYKIIAGLLVIGLILVSGCTSDTENTKAELKQKIYDELPKLNYCEKSEECEILSFGCPFKCVLANADVDQTKIKELIKQYNNTPGFETMECMYCPNVESPEFSCVEKKCKLENQISP